MIKPNLEERYVAVEQIDGTWSVIDSNNQDTASGTQQRQSNDTDAASADRPSNEVTGSINISTEQKTEIRSIIVENKVEPIKPSFSVSVGVAITWAFELHPLPPRVALAWTAGQTKRLTEEVGNVRLNIDPSLIRED